MSGMSDSARQYEQAADTAVRQLAARTGDIADRSETSVEARALGIARQRKQTRLDDQRDA